MNIHAIVECGERDLSLYSRQIEPVQHYARRRKVKLGLLNKYADGLYFFNLGRPSLFVLEKLINLRCNLFVTAFSRLLIGGKDFTEEIELIRRHGLIDLRLRLIGCDTFHSSALYECFHLFE